MINWNKYCDHIYFLHLKDSNHKNFIDNLTYLELYNKKILSIEYYKINNKFNDYKYFKDAKVLDCIVDAFFNNYNRIIIFRDDLLFTDLETINTNLADCMYSQIAILNPGDICEDALIMNKTVIQYIYHHFFNYNIYSQDNWNFKLKNLIEFKFNIYKTKQSICSHKIDYIIPYVNDKDEIWFNKFNEYYSKINHESYNKKNRWNNLDNFIYNIRSVAKNIPWINNLFIIVDSESQIPEWINQNNIKIIYHKDFIPKEFLPVFNSCAIESFIYNIEELSEYFIFSNDDVFITNYLDKKKFFENGHTKNNLINTLLSDKNHYKISNNSFNLINKEFNIKYNNYKRCIHVPHAMLKSSCKHVGEYFKTDIYNSITKFRNNKNLNQYMYVIYEMMSNNNIQNDIHNILIDINEHENIRLNLYEVICIKDSYVYNPNSLIKINNKFNLLFNKQSKYDQFGDIIIEQSLSEEKCNDKKYKVALCAIAKNENLYIREWVEYYKKLGISKIFLYDNNELDGEYFEDVINDYIQNEFVEVINKRGITKSVNTDQDGQTLQGLCYGECYDKYYNDYDWMCLFDIDEFLEIDENYNLNSFLNLFSEDTCDGIHIQWKMYGDNNLLYYDNRSIYERFYNEKNKSNSSLIKTIIKLKEHHKDNLLFCAHGPLKISGKYKQIHIINADFSEAVNPYRNKHKLREDMPAYLNHFYCKSTEEFINRKWKKTSAVTGINPNRNYDINFLKDQYFKYNKITNAKLQLFNNLINPIKHTKKIDKNDKIIVSFTTWKKRDLYVPILLKYFKNQTLQPDQIICWLSNDEYNGVIPDSLKYCLNNGLLTDVKFVNGNTYGHKRYEVFKYNNDAYNILIDDDLYYPIDYIEKLYLACKQNPENVICYYSRHEIYKNNGIRFFKALDKEPSFSNRYFSGLAAFPPNIFPLISFKYIKLRDKYCTKCDDSWVNGWLFKKNIKVKGLNNWGTSSPLDVIGSTQEDGIYETHNGLKINGILQASINIANAISITNTENIAKQIWPEFNIRFITTYNKFILNK